MGREVEAGRWRTFLASGCRTSQEFSLAWNSLQTEAVQCSHYLAEELVGELASEVENVGQGRSDGSTRRLVTQQREELRHKVLTLGLEKHVDRQARPVTVFQNFDKLSGAWLLALPGPKTGLSSAVFVEAFAAHLCLPSPAVTSGGWVGRNTMRGGGIIDQFGDTIMNCKKLPGDTWRATLGNLQ